MQKVIKISKTFLIVNVVFIVLIALLTMFTNYIANKPLDGEAPKVQASETYQYYFAYGANMSARYLANIRKVRPVESSPAILKGYALTFDLEGVNFLEPGFANIRANNAGQVEGVLHRVTEADINRILKSEPDKYKIVELNVEAGGKIIPAKSLIFESDSPTTYKPSKRYINMLARAATEHGLSKEYVDKIKSTEYVYYPGLSEAFGTVIYLAVMFNSK